MYLGNIFVMLVVFGLMVDGDCDWVLIFVDFGMMGEIFDILCIWF